MLRLHLVQVCDILYALYADCSTNIVYRYFKA
jgi:hypothetical protein